MHGKDTTDEKKHKIEERERTETEWKKMERKKETS